MTLAVLPWELQEAVIGFLELPETQTLRTCNRSFRQLLADDTMWMRRYQDRWPGPRRRGQQRRGSWFEKYMHTWLTEQNWRKLDFALSQACVSSLELYSVELCGDSAIAAGGQDGQIRILNAQPRLERRPEAMLAGHTGPVYAMAAPLPNRLISTGADGRVKLWNIQTEECLWTSPPCRGPCYALEAFTTTSSTGQVEHLVACGGRDRVVRVFALASAGRLTHVASLAAQAGTVTCLAGVSPTVKFKAYCSVGAVSWEEASEIEARLHQGGPVLASGDSCGTVLVRRVPSGKLVQSFLEAHRGAVNSIRQLGPTQLASGGDDGVIRVLDIWQGSCLLELQGEHRSSVIGLRIHQYVDPLRMVSVGCGQEVKVWGFGGRSIGANHTINGLDVLSLACDAERMVLGTREGRVLLLDFAAKPSPAPIEAQLAQSAGSVGGKTPSTVQHTCR